MTSAAKNAFLDGYKRLHRGDHHRVRRAAVVTFFYPHRERERVLLAQYAVDLIFAAGEELSALW